MMTHANRLIQAPFSALGGILALLQPSVDYILVCTLAVLMDTYTAWSLSRRVARAYPDLADGKFKSRYAMRVVSTLIKAYALILLAMLIDRVVFPTVHFQLCDMVAGIFCFIQLWSILENESSLNESKWAKILQRVMVDKVERHFDLNLSELKKENKPKNEVHENEGAE